MEPRSFPLALITKNLSRVLRHNPDDVLEIDPHGFASIDSVLDHLNKLKIFGGHLQLVHIDEALHDPHKTRFGLSDDGLRIRALSGHSIDVDLGYTKYYPAGPLYFGTTEAAQSIIEEHGLSLTKKRYNRLVDTYERALEIAEARPFGRPMIVEVDAVALANDGYEFFQTDTDEILCRMFDKKYISIMPSSTKLGL